MATNLPEVWLRGPIEGVPPLLQPVAHALLQAREEVNKAMIHFPDNALWIKPLDMASVGFHLQHLVGVLDRLLTYARNESLTPAQLDYLKSEGAMPTENTTTQSLVQNFKIQVDRAIDQLKATDSETLLAFRGVGRQQLPSTVLGLLFHAAEHTQRHVGQLLVTTKVVQSL